MIKLRETKAVSYNTNKSHFLKFKIELYDYDSLILIRIRLKLKLIASFHKRTIENKVEVKQGFFAEVNISISFFLFVCLTSISIFFSKKFESNKSPFFVSSWTTKSKKSSHNKFYSENGALNFYFLTKYF